MPVSTVPYGAWTVAFFVLPVVAFRGYAFMGMNSNQVSQLPLLLRKLEPAYAAGDWYVNQMQAVGVRTGFINLMTMVSRLMGVEGAYLFMFLASCLAVGLVTWWTMRRVLLADSLAGLAAALMALGVGMHGPCNQASLLDTNLVPMTVALPMSLLAVSLALLKRPLLCGVVSLATVFIQPLLGVVPCVLALVGMAVVQVLSPWERDGGTRSFWFRSLLGISMPVAAALLLAGNQMRGGVDDSQLIHIIGYVRNPHHYIPSLWRVESFGVAGLLFLGLWALSLLAFRWDAHPVRRRACVFFLVVSVEILLLCLAGYVWVELVPLKEVMALMAWRYMYLPLFFVILLLGLVASRVLRHADRWTGCAFALLLLGVNGEMFTVAVLVGAGILLLIRSRSGSGTMNLHWRTAVLLLAGSLALNIVLNLALGLSAKGILSLVLAVAIWGMASFPSMWSKGVPALAAASSVIIGLSLAFPESGAARSGKQFIRIFPTMEAVHHQAEDGRDELDSLFDLGEFARGSLPQDAVVLTPPDFGAFRIIARRAIVVDFKSWNFADPVGWHKRLTDVYGEYDALGFSLLDAMVEGYRYMTVDKLYDVRQRYGADYAIIPVDLDVPCRVLRSTDRYKLVEIRDRVAEDDAGMGRDN